MPADELSRSHKILFIVPARGGSKGLPHKNLCAVGGIPLVGRSAMVARRAAELLRAECRILCSTDDPNIADAAKEWGAEVPFVRPAELATDSARSIDVVIHAVTAAGGSADIVVLLQPTSPLVEAGDVGGAIALHDETGDPVVSICPTEHPSEWLYTIGDTGRLVPAVKANDVHQRQSASKTYRLNGAVYVTSSKLLVEQRAFLGGSTRGYVMPADRSVDVDTRFDLEQAEFILAKRARPTIEILGRKIGTGERCFIIAEAGVNHNGSLDLAIRLVDAAAEAGADAVKFQTFKADSIASPAAKKAAYQESPACAHESQLQMLRRLELSDDAHRQIITRCQEKGITFLSSPFDEGSADFLETLGVPAYKIPSGEITNIPFLAHVARKRLPMIISTGMSTLKEVSTAVETVRGCGNASIVLLQCVSSYPADPASVNLRAMRTMEGAFGCQVGYSDHTEGSEVSLAAAALGATVIEKHFTLDRNLPGPDQKASMEPREFASLVSALRSVERAMGTGEKVPAASEADTAKVARKSIVAACDIPSGSVITAKMLTVKRPGTGMRPELLGGVVGKTARRNIGFEELIEVDMLL